MSHLRSMTEVPLADYLAYCFGEVVRAREMVDAYVKEVAERYARDPVLAEFPVPRFRTPRLTLVVPVLVSDARFEQRSRFDMDPGEFRELISSRAEQVRRAAEVDSGSWAPDSDWQRRRRRDIGAEAAEAVQAFYEELAANPDPSRAEDVVRIWWPTVLELVLKESELRARPEDDERLRRLREASTVEVLQLIRSRTPVDRATIRGVLVDPLTSNVRREGSDSSTFTITAELVEEGFYLRSLTDDATGQTRPLVDFE